MSLKQSAIVVGLVFAITLAVVVGRQLSTEAMAVIIGVVCGVAAGIPTSFLLFVVLSRREEGRQEREQQGQMRQMRQPSYPPVVVIQGGGQPAQPPYMPGGYWPTPLPGPYAGRHFNVVGGEELRMDDDLR